MWYPSNRSEFLFHHVSNIMGFEIPTNAYVNAIVTSILCVLFVLMLCGLFLGKCVDRFLTAST